MTRADKIFERLVSASNPEGINQYSQGGGYKGRPAKDAKAAKQHEEAADRISNKLDDSHVPQSFHQPSLDAHLASAKAFTSGNISEHQAAKDLHEKASSFPLLSHENKNYHYLMAKEHEAIIDRSKK